MRTIQQYLSCCVEHLRILSLVFEQKDLTTRLFPASVPMKICRTLSNSHQTSDTQASSEMQEGGTEGCLSKEEIDINFKKRVEDFAATVNEAVLRHKQREIHRAHLHAIQNGKDFYIDPVTGYKVMSQMVHLRRGECCGNACRHCPYGQKNAPYNLRKIYNTAFYE